MKRAALIVLVLLLAFFCVGCGGTSESTRQPVFSSTPQGESRELPPVETTNDEENANSSPPDPVIKGTQAPTSESTPELTPEPTPEPTPELTPEPTPIPGRDYVLNKNTKKFHYPNCSSVEDMKAKNRRDYNGTRDEIISMGYSPCGRCKP